MGTGRCATDRAKSEQRTRAYDPPIGTRTSLGWLGPFHLFNHAWSSAIDGCFVAKRDKPFRAIRAGQEHMTFHGLSLVDPVVQRKANIRTGEKQHGCQNGPDRRDSCRDFRPHAYSLSETDTMKELPYPSLYG